MEFILFIFCTFIKIKKKNLIFFFFNVLPRTKTPTRLIQVMVDFLRKTVTQEVAIVIHVHVTSRNVQIVYTFMEIMEFDVGPLCHAFFWVKNYFFIFFSGNKW